MLYKAKPTLASLHLCGVQSVVMFMRPILFLCCVGVSLNHHKNNLGEIVFSHILFRHGERMPLEFFPNDVHKNSSKWPFKISQLTDEGQRQLFDLGKWTRSRYAHLISERYDPDQLYAVSTDTDRTLMSAQSFLAGLYTVGAVPVHTTPGHLDQVLTAAATSPCPAYHEEAAKVNALPEVKALLERFATMFNYVSEHIGSKVQDFDTAIKVYDVLSIEEKYNMSLPRWANSIYPEPIKEAGLYSFVLPTWTKKLQRLKVGPLLKQMTDHFLAKRAATLSPDRSLWVYSAHDVTLSSLLNTFKAFKIHFPPYAACVLLELRKVKQEYFVTLSYRNSISEEPHQLKIHGCGTLCPLDQFNTLVQPLLPGDWEHECLLQPTGTNYTLLIIGIIIGITVFILFLLLNNFCLMKKTVKKNYAAMPSPLPKSITNDVKSSHIRLQAVFDR